MNEGKRDSKLAKVLGKTEFRVNSFHHHHSDVAQILLLPNCPDGVVEVGKQKQDRVCHRHPEMLHCNPKVAS